MTRYAALLRGINLGNHNKVKMPDLRALVDGLGHSDVATYLQSGNVVFTSGRTDIGAMEQELARAILDQMGLTVPVIVRTGEELARVLRENPFLPAAAVDRLHVTFLDAEPDASLVDAIVPAPFLPDEFRVVGREIYQHCPNGYGTSKLIPSFWERKLKLTTSARNWKTVTALAQMTSA